MWNYLYYIAYLNWKNAEDYTGIESYISERIEQHDFAWFPFNKAREIDNEDDEEGEQEKKMIDTMKEYIINAK